MQDYLPEDTCTFCIESSCSGCPLNPELPVVITPQINSAATLPRCPQDGYVLNNDGTCTGCLLEIL